MWLLASVVIGFVIYLGFPLPGLGRSRTTDYTITGLHGLHILGGMVALVRTARLVRAEPVVSPRLRLSVELCATYWHFMLAVWLVLLALFAGWAGSIVAFCRQLVT